MANTRQKGHIPARHLNDGIAMLHRQIGGRIEEAKFIKTRSLTDNIKELEYLWEQNWIVQKICSKKANDMTRKWRKAQSNDLDAQSMTAFEDIERRLKLQTTLNEALTWSLLYGGVALLVVTERNPALPLDASQAIQKLVILMPSDVSGEGSLNDDVLSSNFKHYDYYTIKGKVRVHHSRLIIINAIDRPLSEQKIFGLSAIEPVYTVLKRYETMGANVGDLITESKVDVFKMDGLTNALSSGRENDIAQAMSHIQAIKSSTNSLLLDKENEYEQKELTFGGLRDLLVEFRSEVAGAADMPLTILFGQSAAGFASGAEDIQNYHEGIHSLQESILRPVFEVIDPLILYQVSGEVPTDWWFDFNPLSELTAEQKATVLNTFAIAANALVQAGIVTEHQVASELKESGLFSKITDDDLNMLEEDADGHQFTRGGAEPEEDGEAFTEEVQV
ncbi:anti-CBASS protein Acb1 family protein [Pelistega sp. MC2]|uniref:anti-CBASS protein Acb1 family protein n=1 Tax=Pelistega sp. MC2 TaxID=1720297 RepID=UPI0008D99DD0|nr:anti-CBASS Acb1 family protein [Pelistega sp. MC2]